MKKLLFAALALLGSLAAMAQGYRSVKVEGTPFVMQPIHEYIYPDHNFNIMQYGAKADGRTASTKAIAKAIEACSKAGGGHVIIPAGEWITGAIHMMSNVDLHLEEGARLVFTDNPQDYLPEVCTTWEGVECYNYSPLVYAYKCQNIKISGKGTLAPKMDLWRQWFARPAAHIEATRQLYRWCSELFPLDERNLLKLKDSHMRPHLIQFNRCDNVVLEDFHVRESPFWTIHMYHCNEGIVRRLDVYAHGHNNDGIDIDMTSNFLIEDCRFNQGDDAVVIKAGRNQDAWRLHCPSENIVIRNCTIVDGHVLLGIGSEMSGGVQNVWMHDCQCLGNIRSAFYVKTNHRRGGFVRNIHMSGCKLRNARRLVGLDTDVVYQWKDFPDYDTLYTVIDGLDIRDIECDTVWAGIDMNGEKKLPARNVVIENLRARHVTGYALNISNVENVTLRNLELPCALDSLKKKF